jgi:transposase
MTYSERKSQTIPEETTRIARASFPKGNTYMRIRDELGNIYDDSKFAGLFSRVGQPGEAPGFLAMVSIFQFMEGMSDRQTADAVRGRIDWKYALGLEMTDAGFDFSLLSEFRDRLMEGGLEQELLNELLRQCEAKGLIKKRGKQRSDSTHVLGAVRDLNRLEMLGETLRYALNSVSKIDPAWTRQHARTDWYKQYAIRFEAARLPGTEAKRTEMALEIGQAGYELFEVAYAPETPEAIHSAKAIEILRQIWIQQYYLKDGQVCLRESGNLPPGELLIRSPYDLEVRWSQKRQTQWTGYKVHLTETCDEKLPALITNVLTTTATTPDSSVTDNIHQDLSAKGLLPEEHIVDSGYIDAELLVTSQQNYQIELLGPALLNTTWQGRANTGFDLTNFQINWEQRSALCPQEHASLIWSESHDTANHPVIHVRFAAADCLACLCRNQCTCSQKNPRSLKLRPQLQHEALQKARQQQDTEWFKKRYKKRAGIEGTISQGTRAFDLRITRYIGLTKTHLQQCLSAVAMNLVRLAHWFEGIAPAQTRTSSFAALAAT